MRIQQYETLLDTGKLSLKHNWQGLVRIRQNISVLASFKLTLKQCWCEICRVPYLFSTQVSVSIILAESIPREKSNRIHDLSHQLPWFNSIFQFIPKRKIFFLQKSFFLILHRKQVNCRIHFSLSPIQIPIPRLFLKTNSFNLNLILLPTYYSFLELNQIKFYGMT